MTQAAMIKIGATMQKAESATKSLHAARKFYKYKCPAGAIENGNYRIPGNAMILAKSTISRFHALSAALA